MPVDFIKQRFRTKQSGTQYRTVWQLLHLDWPLLLLLFVLVTYGFFILYSASNEQFHMVISQMLHIVFAFVIMFILAQLPPRFYERWSPLLYAIGLFLLLIVLIMGHIDKGAQRWVNLGFFRFQPSELMKLSLLMGLSWYFSHRILPPTFKELCFVGVLIFVPFLLTIKEPDLGTAIMLLLGGGCVLLFAGLRWRYLIIFTLTLLIVAPIGWHFMHAYQQQRILTFLNPARDPLGAGYHIIQSKIAIGSGGFFGKGWIQGTQSHLHFLPEHATDFIFAVCGEEFGFMGCAFLLSLYALITLRCLAIAHYAQDTYTRLLASSLGLMFFLSVFINIGMVTGILPVVGLPLPLISYGGSSMLTFIAGFGILMSIHHHRKLLSK